MKMIENFLPDFIPEYYKSNYPDLSNHDEAQLRIHYDTYGKNEGRIASPMAVRENFIGALLKARRALEIGPFNRPMLSGDNAFFFDVMSQEDLIERANKIGLDSSECPFIHYVSENADLEIVNTKFDVVTSSHSIEHQTNIVKHLNIVEKILNEDGVYAMLVPDCRYCFDHFITPSHIGQILDAYYTNRTRHTLSNIIEHRAMTCHNDTNLHWQGDHGAKPHNIEAIKSAISEWQNAGDNYVDVHAWQFTPDSLASIIDDLGSLGLTNFKVKRLYSTPYGRNEFAIVLGLN